MERDFYESYNDIPTTKGTAMSARRYGMANFFLDCLLTLFTGGLWLIWVFVREMRR